MQTLNQKKNPIRVVLLSGEHCTGKTSYALSSFFDGYERVDAKSFKSKSELESHIINLLKNGSNIVIDDLNLFTKDRSFYINVVKPFKAIIECHRLQTTLSDILLNSKIREALVGERLNRVELAKHRRFFEMPKLEEGIHILIDVPFKRMASNELTNKAIFFSINAVSKTKSGCKIPVSGYDIELMPNVNSKFNLYKDYIFIAIAKPSTEEIGNREKQTQQNIIEVIKLIHVPIAAVYYCLPKTKDSNFKHFDFARNIKEKFKINFEKSIMIGDESDFDFFETSKIGLIHKRDDFFDLKN